MRLRRSHLLRTLYFLILTAIFVPPSAQSYSSWVLFAKDWCIRLAVAIGFVVVTSPLRHLGAANSYRITPAPTQPPSETESLPVETLQTVQFAPAPPALLRKQRLIFALCVCVFFVNIAADWNFVRPLLISPQVIVACISAIFSSFCLAAFTGWILSGILFRGKSVGVSPLARRITLIRQWASLFVVFVVIAAAYWIGEGATRGQPWAERVVETGGRWVIDLICLGCLYIFWMPKSGQMSADQPEVVHVVPSRSESAKAESDVS